MPIYALDGIAPEFDDAATNWIAPDAAVIGDVRSAAMSASGSAPSSAATTSRSRIGARTNVQEHTVMHTDPGFPLTIGEGCTIGHRAHAAWLHDRRQQPDRHGRDRAQRRPDRQRTAWSAPARW